MRVTPYGIRVCHQRNPFTHYGLASSGTQSPSAESESLCGIEPGHAPTGAQCEDVFVFLAFKIKDQRTRSESDELARTLKQLRLLAVQEFTREIQFSKKAETDLAHYAIPHNALIELPFAAKAVEKAARLVAKIRHLVDNPRRTDLVVASPQMPRPASEYEAWPGPAGNECA